MQSDSMLGIMRARAQHEVETEEPQSTYAPGLTAPELVRLLEEYEASPSDAHLDRLAVEYDVDRASLGRLVKFVRAPDDQPLTT